AQPALVLAAMTAEADDRARKSLALPGQLRVDIGAGGGQSEIMRPEALHEGRPAAVARERLRIGEAEADHAILCRKRVEHAPIHGVTQGLAVRVSPGLHHRLSIMPAARKRKGASGPDAPFLG